METKEELIKQCRFYKGEDEYQKSPSSIEGEYLFWKAEKLWVESENIPDLSSISFMVNCGLSDEQMLKKGLSEKYTDIPFNLRCLLFEIYCSHSDTDPIEHAEYFPNVLDKYLDSKSV